MPYFHISSGLRGCYMPDSAFTVKADTRKELKAVLEGEAESIRDSGMVGASKKNIANLCAFVWKNRKARFFTYPECLPYRSRDQNDFPYGLFVSVATRAEYLEFQQES